MRSDDCTAAWTDWLNDFFFISSGSSTAAQPPFPSSSSSTVAPQPLWTHLFSHSCPPLRTHPPITALALTLPATFFFLSARSYAPFLLSKPFHIFFTSLLSGRYSTLLCVSNSDCLQISRIPISTGNRRATISVMSVVETHYVCWQNSLKRLFSRTRVKKEAVTEVCVWFSSTGLKPMAALKGQFVIYQKQQNLFLWTETVLHNISWTVILKCIYVFHSFLSMLCPLYCFCWEKWTSQFWFATPTVHRYLNYLSTLHHATISLLCVYSTRVHVARLVSNMPIQKCSSISGQMQLFLLLFS